MQAIEFLKGALGALRGNRTFLTCILALAYLVGCQWLGKVPDESIIGIFAFLGLSFLRSAVGATRPHPTVPADLTNPTDPIDRSSELHRPRSILLEQPIFSAASAAIFAVLFLAAILAPGCAMQRPYISGRTESTNGVIQSRTVKSTAIALWPATSELAKGRMSAGKTLSVGVEGQALESGSGTNDVEVLRNLRAILGR